MRATALLPLPIILVSLTAAAGDMSVATFLTRAQSLQAQGVLSMASPEIDVLKGEVMGAGQAYRARLINDKKAGKPPHSCPPAKPAISPAQLLAHFRSYPAAARPRTTVRTAIFDMMKSRYPC